MPASPFGKRRLILSSIERRVEPAPNSQSLSAQTLSKANGEVEWMRGGFAKRDVRGRAKNLAVLQCS